MSDQSDIAATLSDPFTASLTSENDPLDQVRSILFGRQMARYDDRIQRLEMRLEAENERLQQLLLARIEAVVQQNISDFKTRDDRLLTLERQLASESDKIRQQIESTRADLQQQVDLLRDELHGSVLQLERKISGTQGHLADLFRDVASKLDLAAQIDQSV